MGAELPLRAGYTNPDTQQGQGGRDVVQIENRTSARDIFFAAVKERLDRHKTVLRPPHGRGTIEFVIVDDPRTDIHALIKLSKGDYRTEFEPGAADADTVTINWFQGGENKRMGQVRSSAADQILDDIDAYSTIEGDSVNVDFNRWRTQVSRDLTVNVFDIQMHGDWVSDERLRELATSIQEGHVDQRLTEEAVNNLLNQGAVVTETRVPVEATAKVVPPKALEQ